MKFWNRLFHHKLKLAPSLQPGDMFVVQTGSFLGRLIIKCCTWMGLPGTYNHAGIITSAGGQTLEANWHFDYARLSDYTGDQILIVRDLGMTPATFINGMNAITPDIGNLYPWWRLPLFLIGIDKYFQGGQGVCSEQTAKFWNATGLYKLIRGIHPVKRWALKKRLYLYRGQVYGLTPDDLALAFRKEIANGKMIAVYDGIL